MIRAIRFATKLSFIIDPVVFDSIRRNRHRLAILSAERVSEELNKILMTPKPSVGFYLLDDATLLDLILPQLTDLKGVETQHGKGHKDNFVHTLKVLDNIVPYTDNLWLRWAALLHDIGKFPTKRYENGIGWTFHGHDVVGAAMVPKVFRHLRMPMNEKMKYVAKMVQLHLRPIALVQEEVTDSAVRRLLFDAGDDVWDLMTLCEADITSGNGKVVEKHRKNFQLVRQKLKDVVEKDDIRNFKNPVTGELIMQCFGIGPCALIGTIKEAVKKAIIDKEIENSYEAAVGKMMSVAAELGLTQVAPLPSSSDLLETTPF